jgi:hypothetical protein
MYIKIYKEKKSATQSCVPNHNWIIEIIPSLSHSFTDNTMSWNGTEDTHKQIKLKFSTYESALEYAKSNGMKIVNHGFKVGSDKRIKKSYLDNF